MMPSPTPPSPASADRRTASSTPVNDISQLLPVDAATRASVRILVIDDERTLRESCASALQVEGYRVQTCGRGDEARSEEHTSELQSPYDLVCRLLLEKKTSNTTSYSSPRSSSPSAPALPAPRPPRYSPSLRRRRPCRCRRDPCHPGAWSLLPPRPATS